MLFGLSLGLVVAAAVYFSDRRVPAGVSEPTPQPAATSARVAPEPEPPHPATRFDFYEILPKFEVVIPERDSRVRADTEPVAVAEPGRYVLQTGSFIELTDADRMQANLALLGIESRIQRVTIDDDVFHRVRIGPVSDLDQLNGIRRRLRDAEIEALLIEVPD